MGVVHCLDPFPQVSVGMAGATPINYHFYLYPLHQIVLLVWVTIQKPRVATTFFFVDIDLFNEVSHIVFFDVHMNYVCYLGKRKSHSRQNVPILFTFDFTSEWHESFAMTE